MLPNLLKHTKTSSKNKRAKKRKVGANNVSKRCLIQLDAHSCTHVLFCCVYVCVTHKTSSKNNKSAKKRKVGANNVSKRCLIQLVLTPVLTCCFAVCVCVCLYFKGENGSSIETTKKVRICSISFLCLSLPNSFLIILIFCHI